MTKQEAKKRVLRHAAIDLEKNAELGNLERDGEELSSQDRDKLRKAAYELVDELYKRSQTNDRPASGSRQN